MIPAGSWRSPYETDVIAGGGVFPAAVGGEYQGFLSYAKRKAGAIAQ